MRSYRKAILARCSVLSRRSRESRISVRSGFPPLPSFTGRTGRANALLQELPLHPRVGREVPGI